MSDKTAGGFTALLEEIGEDLSKALPAAGDGDDKIAAAAAEGEGEGEESTPGAGEGETVTKSFKLTLEDGTEVDAIDGGELIKSLIRRIETNEGAVVTAIRGAAEVITKQGELIKSLQAEVGALANAGRGRKAVVAIVEKPAAATEDLAKSEQAQGLSGEEFMAKALIAQGSGRINGTQIAIAEAHINSGKAPPADIVRAVLTPAQ